MIKFAVRSGERTRVADTWLRSGPDIVDLQHRRSSAMLLCAIIILTRGTTEDSLTLFFGVILSQGHDVILSQGRGLVRCVHELTSKDFVVPCGAQENVRKGERGSE